MSKQGGSARFAHRTPAARTPEPQPAPSMRQEHSPTMARMPGSLVKALRYLNEVRALVRVGLDRPLICR